MKLSSRGARRTLAVACSTAVVAAGASFFAAAPASAAGVSLAYGPTGTTATVTNLDPTAAAGASILYGMKITGATSTDADQLRLKVLTGPSNASAAVYSQRVYTHGSPAANPTGAVVPAAAVVPLTVTGTSGSTSLTVSRAPVAPAADLTGYVVRIGSGAPYQYAKIASGGATTTWTLDRALTASVTDVAVKSMGTEAGATAVDDTGGAGGAAVTSTGSSGSTALSTSVQSGDPAADLTGYVLRIGAGAPYQYAKVSTDGGTALTLDRNLTADVAAANLYSMGLESGAANITGSTAETGAGTAGTTTLTAVANLNGDIRGHVLRIGNSAPYQYGVVANAGDTTGTTSITLDRQLTSTVSNVTIWDLGTPSTTATTTPIGTFTPVGAIAPITNYVTSTADNIFLGASYPGTYTLQFFKDRNNNSAYDPEQDDATPVFSLDVKDVNATTSATTDDLSPSLNVVSSIGVGQAITPTVSTGLTYTDTRGLNGSGVGVLGASIAAASTIGFTANGTGIGSGGAASFDGTNLYRTSAASSSAGTTAAVTTFTLGSVTRTASTAFAGSDVDAVAEDVTDVSGTVKDAAGTSARAVAVKVGTGAVTYKATVTDGGTAVAGATVYFSLTTGTNTPALTADGTLVSSTSTTKVYSATSNSSGIATLVVTSGTTGAGTTYTVTSSSNGVTADTLTATYAEAAATSIDNTNTSASLLATPGSSVTLTGRLLDQFDGAYTPSGSAPLQVAVRMPAGSGTVVGQAAFTGAAFSYTYTPSTTPTAGSSTSFDFYYNSAIDGTDSAINWASTENPASISITAPASTVTPTQQKATIAPVAGTNVTGLVLNSSNAAMPYKLVELTGSEGVFFSSASTPTSAATDDLTGSITVSSNGAGVYSAYAYFMKAGTATITVTSGTTASQHVDVSVTQVADPYQVIAVDSSVAAGSTSVVTGRVKNAWGFPVSGAQVSLSLGASTIAALGNNTVTTSADGVWSTTITGSNSGDGEATLTATVNGDTANRTANTAWLDNAGMTIAHGEYQDTATITVAPPQATTIAASPATRVGTGYVTLHGKALANSTVEIYAKRAGSADGFVQVGLTTADSDGDWSSQEIVIASTIFFAKNTSSTSAPVTVTVTKPVPTKKASVKVSAKVLGKGVVKVSANGSPNIKGSITFYVNGKAVKTVTSNAAGDGSLNIKTSKGKKTFKVVFAPKGYTAGSASVTVTVK